MTYAQQGARESASEGGRIYHVQLLY